MVDRSWRHLADILDDVAAFVSRFVVFGSDAQPVAAALWIAHTHAFAAAETTPYLAVTAPAKRSGKTRLLEVLELLARDTYHVSNTSVAALFRLLDERQATLLLDEVDAIFKARGGDTAEALRGILNAGHRRGAVVTRMGGANMRTLELFEVFSPKAIAGIGDLPDTISDRSIPIRLQRRAPSEHVERFRRREAVGEATGLRDMLAVALEPVIDFLRDARPEIPDGLNDRAQDSWEPLLAIADLAAGDWPTRAREAALVLSADTEPDDDTAAVRLLADVASVWPQGSDTVATSELLEALHHIEEAPWSDWYGKALNAHGLARLLRPYGVKPRQIRFGDRNLRRFRWQDLSDTVSRYTPTKTATPATSLEAQGISANSQPLHPNGEIPPKPLSDKESSDVAVQSPLQGLGQEPTLDNDAYFAVISDESETGP